MKQRFDTILKSGTVVNQDGDGLRDIGVPRPDRGDRRSRPRCRRRNDRLSRPAYPARRDRYAGAFPRARPDAQGRPGDGVAQRRDGRRHRRVRDAEHQSADHHRGGVCRQGGRPPAHALRLRLLRRRHARECPDLPELERAPGGAGIKVFMGSSTGELLVEDDESLRRILGDPPPRRLPCRGRIPPQRTHDDRIDGDPCSHPVWRDEPAALMATQRLVKLARETRDAHPCAAYLDQAGNRVPARPQGRRLLRGDAASSDAGRARLLRAARHACADESAGARKPIIATASGAASSRASSTCSAPTMRRIRWRRRRRPIRPRRPA